MSELRIIRHEAMVVLHDDIEMAVTNYLVQTTATWLGATVDYSDGNGFNVTVNDVRVKGHVESVLVVSGYVSMVLIDASAAYADMSTYLVIDMDAELSPRPYIYQTEALNEQNDSEWRLPYFHELT